jgi:hypothetical protein
LREEGIAWSAQWIPMAVNLSSLDQIYPQVIGVKTCYAMPGGIFANKDNNLMLQQSYITCKG